MQMQMGDALTDDVIHRDERSLGFESTLHATCHELGGGEEGLDQW